jgi:ferredoxin
VIVIAREKCTGCGSCAEICHEHCMSVVDGSISIDFTVCSTCTQCIAICPRMALSWDHVQPIGFDPTRMPSAAQMDELFRQRRTIRSFTEQRIAPGLIEEIVSYGACAPTHNFDFRCIIVDDPSILAEFESLAFKFSSRMYGLLFRSFFIRTLVRVMPQSLRDEYQKVKPKLEIALKRGSAYSSRPPAMICLVADRRVPLSTESAQYALYTMNLYAQVRGVGSRNLVGNRMIFNRNREIRDRLHLKKHERIFGLLGLGYSSITFRNKVQGRGMKMQWNGG